jgi:hypothetical protein
MAMGTMSVRGVLISGLWLHPPSLPPMQDGGGSHLFSLATPPSLTLNAKWMGLLVSSLLAPSPSPQKRDEEVIMGCDVVHITPTTRFGISCHHHHPSLAPNVRWRGYYLFYLASAPSLTLNMRWRGFLLPFFVNNPCLAPNTKWRGYLLVLYGNSPLPCSKHKMEGVLSLSTPPPSHVM